MSTSRPSPPFESPAGIPWHGPPPTLTELPDSEGPPEPVWNLEPKIYKDKKYVHIITHECLEGDAVRCIIKRIPEGSVLQPNDYVRVGEIGTLLDMDLNSPDSNDPEGGQSPHSSPSSNDNTSDSDSPAEPSASLNTNAGPPYIPPLSSSPSPSTSPTKTVKAITLPNGQTFYPLSKVNTITPSSSQPGLIHSAKTSESAPMSRDCSGCAATITVLKTITNQPKGVVREMDRRWDNRFQPSFLTESPRLSNQSTAAASTSTTPSQEVPEGTQKPWDPKLQSYFLAEFSKLPSAITATASYTGIGPDTTTQTSEPQKLLITRKPTAFQLAANQILNPNAAAIKRLRESESGPNVVPLETDAVYLNRANSKRHGGHAPIGDYTTILHVSPFPSTEKDYWGSGLEAPVPMADPISPHTVLKSRAFTVTTTIDDYDSSLPSQISSTFSTPSDSHAPIPSTHSRSPTGTSFLSETPIGVLPTHTTIKSEGNRMNLKVSHAAGTTLAVVVIIFCVSGIIAFVLSLVRDGQRRAERRIGDVRSVNGDMRKEEEGGMRRELGPWGR